MKFPFFSGNHAQRSSVLRVQIGIFKIASASKRINNERTNASFHAQVAGDSSSATFVGGFGMSDVIGLGIVSLGIQLSAQIRVVDVGKCSMENKKKSTLTQ